MKSMKFRQQAAIIAVLFTALIVALSSLDSDIKTLSKAGIVERKPEIIVNQLGYLPQWHKVAFFRQSTAFNFKEIDANDSAELVDSNTGEAIAKLPLDRGKIDPVVQDKVYSIDFSSVNKPGAYFLKLGKFESAPFSIGTDIYQQPLITLLRSYYLQRCGVAINDPITGISHAPCHVKDGLIAHQDQYHAAGAYVQALGGWHDTGAYNKYVATTTVTIANLLNLYAQYPALFPDSQLSIPESGNGVSDLLDEMAFGLDWLLKMQREDGAVYRKLSGKKWPMNLAPDQDKQPRYLYGISTPETAKFAAVMAIASRNYQSVNPEMAAKYLAAAESAWQYLQTQEMKVDWVKGDDSGSDRYLFSDLNQEESLKTDTDDRLWAAAELYITTGKQDFAEYFSTYLDRVNYTLFEWKNPAPLALVDYLRQQRQSTSDELVAKIKTKILQRADLILANVNQSAYAIANDRFIWGSNKMTAEDGVTLVYAYQLTKNQAYFNGAIAQLDYILGRNHFDQTFITGIGTNPVKHLSNLYTRAKNISLTGLVVGGPNAKAQDGMVYINKGQLSYIDDQLSYTTNENAIDFNASVISLMVNLIMNANS